MNILVTGGEGMIGNELKRLLLKAFPEGALEVRTADIKTGQNLTDFGTCLELCKGADYIFHLAGIKGSPKKTRERPVDFMGPMLQFDTNMILAAQKQGVKKFLYTSSIAVEHPDTDKYPAHAKKTAETLIDAMRIQYPKGTEYCIVRPSNVYGRFDNFEAEDPMVVTSLIKQAIELKEVRLHNDGGDIRDFINAKDVARGMIQAMEEMKPYPVNLCSGEGVTIMDVADIITDHLGILLCSTSERGTTKRVMDINWYFSPEISLKDGIKEVIKCLKR